MIFKRNNGQKKTHNIRKKGTYLTFGGGYILTPTHPLGTLLLSYMKTRIYFMFILRQNFLKNNQEQTHPGIRDFPTKPVLRTSKHYYTTLFSKGSNSQNLWAVIQLKLILNANKIVIKTSPQQLFPVFVLKSA